MDNRRSILSFRRTNTGLLQVCSALSRTTQRQLFLHPLPCQFEFLHHVRELFVSQIPGNIWPQGTPPSNELVGSSILDFQTGIASTARTYKGTLVV